MKNLFNVNGLQFWDEDEILVRNQMTDFFALKMKEVLLDMNSAWKFYRTEGPLLTPNASINKNYTNEDVWMQEVMDTEEPLTLRPETTPSSYAYGVHLLNSHMGVKPPFVVWQSGKSFRREQMQPTKFCRFKEFHQLEFQCVYTIDTANDYHAAILDPVRKMISQQLNKKTRIVESDRLPSYSEVTMDVEVFVDDRWMEVCSISRRTDFPETAKFTTKKGVVEKELLVLEVAIGLDRCVYNFFNEGDTNV